VSNEEVLDRAEAENQTAPRQAAADLLDRRIPLRSERSHHGVMMRIDATRPPVATERLRTRITLFALTRLPTAHACSAHTEAFCSLAM
jgi:hypothetical protein